jgi:hypothetical protein
MRLRRTGSGSELSFDDAPDAVATDGVVMIEGASHVDVQDLLARWTVPASHPHECEAGLTIVTPRSGTESIDGLAGFGRSHLVPHTDRSLDPDPPSLVGLVMLEPGNDGGSGLLVDGARLLVTLCQSFGRGSLESLRLRTRDGRTLPVVEGAGGLVRLRFRGDGLASLYSDVGNDAILSAWSQLVAHATEVRLGVGDGYLVHNHRYLHGRASFSGPRRLARIMANLDESHRLAWMNEGFRVASA